MRYANPAAKLVRTMSAILNGFGRKRLNVEELSEHMRRDLGLAEGMERGDVRAVDNDGRIRNLGLLTLTPVAS